MSGFAHLHVHTDHSLLDGVGRSREYAELATQMGQTALAITDHGHLYGLPEHRSACKAAGIKPIYGCEFYVNDTRENTAELNKQARKEEQSKDQRDPTFIDNHLVVLCESDAGWKNLLRLNHDAVMNGYYYRPRTTHELVCQHNEGLIATTACMGSQFARLAMQGDMKRMRALLGQFHDAFGDRFFYELHVNELEDQKKLNLILAHECGKMGIEPVLTCDVHYACQGDSDRQDEMVAISRHQRLDDPKLFKLSARHLHFAGPRDMYAASKKWGYQWEPGLFNRAANNTGLIAARCNAEIYGDGELRPPRYIHDSGHVAENPYQHLKALAVEGFRQRFVKTGRVTEENKAVYIARLKHELAVIDRCHMSDFYLVTMDVVKFCRSVGIYVWTRGSGCASLVAAAIGITPIDPIEFALVFERFVDPSRPNAPDFDLDIDADRRPEVVNWLVKKYGGPDGSRVARIVALATFGLKAALRDVISTAHGVTGVAYELSEAADLLEKSEHEALENCKVADRTDVFAATRSRLRELSKSKGQQFIDQQPSLVDAALCMVNRTVRIGRHAAGYVVAPGPLIEHMPITKMRDDKDPHAQPDGNVVLTAWGEGQARQDISGTGLMKIDLLALDTVSVVSNAVAYATKRHGRNVAAEIDPMGMDWADENVLREFASGSGFGLHQLNQSDQSLAGFMRKVKPKSVHDVVAVIAMYRPGSLEYLEPFVARSHGLQEVEPVHPVFDAITAPTYGIIVYQEQIMRILHDLGGIPMREAYKVIKAISKKDLPVIQATREQFLIGCKPHGVSKERALEIFAIIEKFAGYGFNLAHSASYGVLSWITAYLRAYYPTEFWWAWLNRTDNETAKGNRATDRKVVLIMREAARAGIELIPPAAGRSRGEWFINKAGSLVAPLSLIMGVGPRAADMVADAFKQERWPDVFEFLRWCESNKKVLNKAALISLAKAGALSVFGLSPEYAYDLITEWAGLKASKKNGTQTDQLWALAEQANLAGAELGSTIPDAETRMHFEKAALGFAYWNNPWVMGGRQEKVIKLLESGRIADETQRRVRGKRRAFQVAGVRKFKDKNENEMAFLTLQSMVGGSVKGVVFSSVWTKLSRQPRIDGVYLIAGEFDHSGSYMIGGKNPFVSVDAVEVRL